MVCEVMVQGQARNEPQPKGKGEESPDMDRSGTSLHDACSPSCFRRGAGGMRFRSVVGGKVLKRLLTLWLLMLAFASLAQSEGEARFQRLEQTLEGLAQSGISGLNETANLSVSKAPIQDFMRGLAATHNLNVSVDPTLDVRVTNNFSNVRVLNLLLFLVREYQLDIRVTGSILSFSRFAAPVPPLPQVPAKQLRLSYDPDRNALTSDLAGDSLAAFAKQVTQLTKSNVVLAPGLRDRIINGYIENMPLPEALEKIAYSNNLRMVRADERTFILQPAEEQGQVNGTNRPPGIRAGGAVSAGGGGELYVDVQQGDEGSRLISVDAANVPIVNILNEVSNRVGINYVLFSNLQGNTTLNVKRISYNEFLAFLLQGTSHTFRINEGIYLVGDRSLEGFRSTKVVKMQFRPVEKLDETIPAELKKGVEIKLFKELNSVILSGGAPQIQEIGEFLKAIDQPVVNVLIEVLVVELRKGHAVKTGIKGALSDSTVATRGQVLGGVDVTVGSKSINDLLARIDATGFINLGRVTPNFYVTLQALEQNNYLSLRSTPQLSTLNGHEANLKIGQSVYYLEQTQNVIGGVTPITTVSQQFKEVSANLNIKINPMVSGDEHITLDIKAEFSDFVPPTIPGAPPGNATREFTSMIRVKNQEMIVLGGLEEVSQAKAGSGVPLLSRIPLIKYLFSSRSESKNNNRLLVFIKPTLLY
jgi:type IV pilus assembly protein PilQ